MADYQAPLKQMRFTIDHLAEFKDVSALPDFSAVDGDMVSAVLEEAGKFAAEVLAPTNGIGDQQGAKVVDRAVQVPAEFAAAYAQFREGGWPGIAANPDIVSLALGPCSGGGVYLAATGDAAGVAAVTVSAAVAVASVVARSVDACASSASALAVSSTSW